MQTLPAYLFRHTLWPTCAALIIMLCLIWLLQSLRFLDFVINKGLGLGTFIQLTGMLVPSLLTIILPLAVFAGVAYSLKQLGDESELTSLFATGWSRLWVLTPALLLALGAVALSYTLHLAIIPASTTAFKDLQYRLRSGQSDLLLEEGTFNQLGSNLMVYLKHRTTPTTFQTLLVHDTRKPESPTTWMAQSGEVTTDAQGNPRLLLRNGMQQQVTPERIEALQFAQHNLDLSSQLAPAELSPRSRELEEYSLSQLWHGTGARTLSHRAEMYAEAHRRLLWPLSPLALTLWAGACLLRAPGRQSSSMQSLAIASGVAIVYMSLLLGARGMAENGNMLVLYGQWALPLLLAAASLYRIRTLSYG